MSNQDMPEWMRKLLENNQITAGRNVNITNGNQVIVNVETGKDKSKSDGEDTIIATRTVKK